MPSSHYHRPENGLSRKQIDADFASVFLTGAGFSAPSVDASDRLKWKCQQRRSRFSAVAAIAVAISAVAFCFVTTTAAQDIQAPHFVGTWSTATLSEARHFLAATSFPDYAVAIFAGGYSTSRYGCLSCCCVRLIFEK
jgi:hypothetical protein